MKKSVLFLSFVIAIYSQSCYWSCQTCDFTLEFGGIYPDGLYGYFNVADLDPILGKNNYLIKIIKYLLSN